MNNIDHSNITNTTYNTTIFVHPGSDMQEIENWQEKLMAILQQIPSKANSLKPIIQFLVSVISPAKIYLLNHHEDGQSNSEYTDLLIVISSKTTVSFTELEPILDIVYLKNQKVSCSLHNEGSVLEGLRNGHIFYSLNFIKENLVYDDKVLEYPITPPEALQTMKQNALERFIDCYDKANGFYECALFMNENRSTSITIFHLHQAAEQIFRGILLSLNGYDKRTHEIRVLKKYVRRCAQPLNECLPDANDNDKRLLDILEKAYLRSRYEDNYVIDANDIAYLFDAVKQLLFSSKDYVQKRLQF